MKAADVKENAMQEMNSNTYLVGLDEFLDAMFPFAEAADRVYEDLCKQEAYNEEATAWTHAPHDAAAEAEYCSWFANTAEEIKETYSKLFNQQELTFLNKWMVNPNGAPSTLSDIASIVRPLVNDVLLSGEKLQVRLQQVLEDELLEKRSALIKARGNGQKYAVQQAALLQKLSVWWSRVNVVVEIKKTVSLPPLEHIVQLVGYLQQVLGEQLDRRSVIGLLCCHDELAVWHADRSGVLGTQEAFNVHLHPKKFIQVILGCSFGTPSMLGYDTSMRLWLPKKNFALPSYHPDVTSADFQRSNAEKNWLISMPAAGDRSRREEFLTINAINTARTSNISGRATAVWVTMKYGDRGKGNHKIYVLKQSWRPAGTPAEWTLIQAGVANIPKVHSYEDVGDEQGKEISTIAYLRHGLVHTTPDPPHASDLRDVSAAQLAKAAKPKTSKSTFTFMDKEITMECTIPVSRVQSRILMEDYGWPIHQFRDLYELLKILKEVVSAQKTLYFEHHTLQRDISIGNILIIPPEPGQPAESTRACLIDFEYAKRAKATIPSTLGSLNKIKGPWIDQEYLESVRGALREFEGANIAPQLDRLVGLYLKPFQGYLPQALEVLGLEGRPELTSVDLGLLDESERLPNFRSRPIRSREIRATAPFASFEILWKRKRHSDRLPRPLSTHTDLQDFTKHLVARQQDVKLHHDAIHDAEALFWLLTYICLTRSGPGGSRREELQEDQDQSRSSKSILKLNDLCDRIFNEADSTTMGWNKYNILCGDDDDEVTEYFAPYFLPLQNLWVQWRDLLEFAYSHLIFERIHDAVLTAIDTAMKEVEQLSEALPEKVSGSG